jgi:hypothetical protein
VTTPSNPLDEAQLAAACHANFVEFAREKARWSGNRGELAERSGAVLFSSGSDFPVESNGAIRLDPTADPDDVIDVADAWFSDRGKGWSLATSSAIPGDDALAARAEDRGLLRILDSPAMVCDGPLEPAVAPDGTTLRVIDDAAGVAELVAICDAAYQSLGMPAGVIADMVTAPDRVLVPHVKTVVAADGTTPVACAQLLLGNGVAGVYYVGTVAAARGRGLAELVTRYVTNLGFELGAPVVTLQASSMGEPIYRRMGYREISRYTTHTRFV